MKVKELIQELSKLDQEKDIWTVYDCCCAFTPYVTKIEDDDFILSQDKNTKPGDYQIDANGMMKMLK